MASSTPPSAALCTLTMPTLWQQIMAFQGGLPTQLLQFETHNFLKLLHLGRKWMQLHLEPWQRASSQGLNNGEWLALALLQNRYDVAQCIVDWGRERAVDTSEQLPMFTVGAAARIVAIEGTTQQLQWLEDRGLMCNLPSTLLARVAIRFMASKCSKLRRQQMEAVMRWLIAHYPTACQQRLRHDCDYQYKFSVAFVLEFGQHILPSVLGGRYVDWKNIGLTDLMAIAQDQPELIHSNHWLQAKVVSGNDLEVFRFLFEAQGITEEATWMRLAASHGDLEKVRLIRSHSDGPGVEAAISAAVARGHEDIVRYLCEQDGLKYEDAVPEAENGRYFLVRMFGETSELVGLCVHQSGARQP